MRIAADDVVAWCNDLGDEDVSMLDHQLASAELPTLTAMRDAQYPRALGILDRGVVRNEDEWRLLDELVADDAGTRLSAAERDRAERLLSEFQSK